MSLNEDLTDSFTKSIKIAELEQENQKLKSDATSLTNSIAQSETTINQLNEKVSQFAPVQQNLEIAQNEIKNNRLEIISRNDQINKLRISLSEQKSIGLAQLQHIKNLEEKNAAINNNIADIVIIMPAEIVFPG